MGLTPRDGDAPPLANTDSKPWQEFAESAHALEGIMRDVLMQFHEQPYRGPATHAQLMDAAMKRFNIKYGQKVPKAWVKLMNDYRRASYRQS